MHVHGESQPLDRSHARRASPPEFFRGPKGWGDLGSAGPRPNGPAKAASTLAFGSFGGASISY
jgi:hypothetical protein